MLRRKAPGAKVRRSLLRAPHPTARRERRRTTKRARRSIGTGCEEIVADLTARIEAMGPVNLGCRQGTETPSSNARSSSKSKTPISLIPKLDFMRSSRGSIARRGSLFADTFAKIRENFHVMFAELFGGGRANLLLTDESDPARERDRDHRQTYRRRISKHLPPLRRRTHDDRGLAPVRHLHGQAQPVLRAGRDGCPARRIEHQPIYQNPGPFRRPEPNSSLLLTISAPISRRRALRGDHGRARRQQAGQREIYDASRIRRIGICR